MGRRSPEVDAYIARAADFARPVLRELRRRFHKASPEIDEAIKWGCPSFEHQGIVGGMASFKRHVSWGLWKAALIDDPDRLMKSTASSPMGGGSVANVDELPPESVMLGWIRQAVDLNKRGVKPPARAASARPPTRAPADLAKAIRKRTKASATWAALSPSHRREYVDWVQDAKRPETRLRRIAQSVLWLEEGKTRHWKYERPKKASRRAIG